MADALLADTKPPCAFRLVGIGIFPHIPRQRDPVDLCGGLVASPAWFKPLQPPHNRRDANTKPFRNFGDGKAFLLANGKNLTAKINRVCHPSIIIILYELGYNWLAQLAADKAAPNPVPEVVASPVPEVVPEAASKDSVPGLLRTYKGIQYVQTHDGFLNASEMCRVHGKRWEDYHALATTREFWDRMLQESKMHGGHPDLPYEHEDIWLSPNLSGHLADWCSPGLWPVVDAWLRDYPPTSDDALYTDSMAPIAQPVVSVNTVYTEASAPQAADVVDSVDAVETEVRVDSATQEPSALVVLPGRDVVLTVHEHDGEPRILDIDLAARLGFVNPRMIRKLIKRHEESLQLLGPRSTVEHRPERGGTPEQHYYLNRKQAIFITAKSETQHALDITIEIIERFDAYERAAAPRPNFGGFEIPTTLGAALLLPGQAQLQVEEQRVVIAEKDAVIVEKEGVIAGQAATLALQEMQMGVIRRLESSGVTKGLRETARFLGISPQQALFTRMHQMNWIFMNYPGGGWQCKQAAVDVGHVSRHHTQIERSAGPDWVENVRITGKGLRVLLTETLDLQDCAKARELHNNYPAQRKRRAKTLAPQPAAPDTRGGTTVEDLRIRSVLTDAIH